ncbi:GNAT family N-acetyltransferase [Vibrio cyclitrophicus]|uniref:GNAT family N-acetyltransferase n=1 Tax=Vibrio TaxID=662 RepID=UPI00037F2FD9|nr:MULTISPECIES: GNAT family N-acetyltransferase [Vibrio]KNH13022.1 acetyltransferase [Vibrio lentus]MBE8557483.1 GNAT family N-acetyltransferase [Vibrio sp. OPT24]OEE27668.1 GNAT family N-acetyltransferase [Vibrio cyclitrophicus ZF170]PME26575.1 GNAT family N-acetyltransferase [Vibrio cyclitrophicus]PME94383.1 GNAT family N-acetyltransferase [Vibrio cyclitrophicus]
MEIQIRHLELTDYQDIFDIYRQPSVSENTSQKPFLSSDQVERLFGHSDHFTLVAEVSGKVVGHITLFMTTKVRDRHCAGLAIAVNPDMQGKGVGKVLMQEAINQADNWLNLVRLELEVHADNHGATTLYESVGFQLEGTKKLSTFKGGKYVDMLLMSRIRHDYR